MKRLLFFVVLIFATALLSAQITEFPFTESFENETFPPTGWEAYPLISGDMNFDRTTSGSWPDCSPYDGIAMAKYNAFNASAGEEALLITPELILGEDNSVSFWFFRSEDPSNNRRDKIEIFYNSEPQLEGATLLDTVNRAINFYPEVPTEDWYQYSFAFNHPGSTYIIIKATSAYGWYMYLDAIEVETTTVDITPPEVVWLHGTQVYAEQEMLLELRVLDDSEMPETLETTCTINNVATEVIMTKTDGGKGHTDYEATLSGQPNHSSGEILFHLIDMAGNAVDSDTYTLNWDWIQPILEEGFEGEEFPPAGWTILGEPTTWLTWDDYVLVYYTDSDLNEYEVYPVEGERQAALEWDFQYNNQDEWLITPEVAITEKSSLVFNQFVRYGGMFNDVFIVIISTDGFNWETIWDAGNYPDGVSDYNEQVNISLEDYIGEDVYIAWRAYNTMGGNVWYSWFVDDVKICYTDTTVGIQEQRELSLSTAYPNPCSENVQISIETETSAPIELTLFDVSGKKVSVTRFNPDGGNRQVLLLPTADLNSGIYFYRATSEKKIYQGKIVKR